METANKANIGKRIQMHCATDAWMRGDKFGEIVGIGSARAYLRCACGCDAPLVRPYLVRLDVSGRKVRVHPLNLFLID